MEINDFQNYQIKRETLTALADVVRKISGRNKLLTPEEFIQLLNRAVFIPQGYAENIHSVSQTSSASGIVPIVYRGRAISTQSISNTSNAAGSIVESA